jgi:hypothetical protein
MDFHPSELPSEGDLFEFERFDKGYDAEDICCVVCGAPSFVVEAEVRNKNLERYKWFVPQAIRAENYHYEKDWDIASLPNHDLPLEVLGIDGGLLFQLSFLYENYTLPKRFLIP